MTTAVANLDTSQYVKVNSTSGAFTLQAHRDTVRIAFSQLKPSRENTAFHELGGTERESVLQVPYTETGIWVLAMTDRSKLTVTNYPLLQAGITDRQGRAARISQKGELVTGGYVDDVDINFQYTIRDAEVVSTVTGSGAISHPGAAGAYAQLSPGTEVGSAQLVSRAPVRYRGGHEVYGEISHIFRTPEANLNQWFGFLNDNDRLVAGYQGLSFGFLIREGGNDTFVAQSNFNIDKLDGAGPSGYTINPQKINVSQCAFIWHGGLPLTLQVQIGQQWFPVHVFDFSNQIDETHLENPHLPIGALIERVSGTGTDEAMKTGSWRGGAISSSVAEPSDDWLSHAVIDHILDQNLPSNVMTLTNPTEWKGKQNHIVYRVGLVTFTSSANKTALVYGVKGATLVGQGSLTSIDEDNYALQYQDGGTASGGSQGPATIIRPGGEREIDERNNGVLIYPGESLTVWVEPKTSFAAGSEFSAVLRLIHEG